MLDQNQFQKNSQQLVDKLRGLWLFIYFALTAGTTPAHVALIRCMLDEINRLHAEMFPDLEHSLYSDDFLSLLEGDRFDVLDEPPLEIDEQTLHALDEDWLEAGRSAPEN